MAGKADSGTAPPPPRPRAQGPGIQQPTALLYGRGHVVVHGNAAFRAEFGAGCLGLPAAEGLVDWPPIILEVVDRVIAEARPLACWVEVAGVRRRLTLAPRADVETGEVYGVALRLASAED